MTGDTVKGPASCFPSIEKTCGQPVAHWISRRDGVADRAHMQRVAFLDSEHGIGHGHANAREPFHRAQC